MSNLALSQGTWNRLFREMGLWCAAVKDLRDKERKFNLKRNRTQVFEILDANSSTSLWTLSGAKIGTNTDEDGFLYVRITDESPGAGQATVNLYKTTGGGGGDLVATGSAANGAVATLSASNSSGLTGTVKLGTVGASESNDAHKLQVFPDYGLRSSVVWDGTVSDDGASARSFLDACVRAEASITSAIAQVQAGFQAWLQNRFANLMVSGQSSPMTPTTTSDDGEITTTYVGTLEDGRLNMADDSTPQKVIKNVVASGAGVFDANNDGAGTMAAPTMNEWARAGSLTFVCVDETVGAEQFAVTLKDTATGAVRTSDNPLQVGKTFSDPTIGVYGALLVRAPSFTAPDNDDFATISDWSFEGENATNTNDGELYFKTAAGTVDPTKFVTKIYKSSSYGSSTLVAQTEEGANNAVVAINAKNGSGLTGVGKIGDACAVAQTCTFSLNCFKTINAVGIPDKFTVAVTVTSRGDFQDRIGELFGYYLNSAASGAETIDDSYASAGTFPAYEVRDC